MMFEMEKCLGRSGTCTPQAPSQEGLFAGGETVQGEGAEDAALASVVAAASHDIGDILDDELGAGHGADLANLGAELGLLAGLTDPRAKHHLPTLLKLAMASELKKCSSSGSSSSSSSWSNARARRPPRPTRVARRRPIAKGKEVSRRRSAAARRAACMRVRRVEVVSDASDVGADSDSDEQWTELDDQSNAGSGSGSCDSTSETSSKSSDMGNHYRIDVDPPHLRQFLLPLISNVPNSIQFRIRHDDILQLLATEEEDQSAPDLPALSEGLDNEPYELSADDTCEFEEPPVSPEEEATLLHYVCGGERGSMAMFKPTEEWMLGVFHSWCEVSALIYTLIGTDSSAHRVCGPWAYRVRLGCHCRLCICSARAEPALACLLRDLVWTLAHGECTVPTAAYIMRSLRLSGDVQLAPQEWDMPRLKRIQFSDEGAAIIHSQLVRYSQQNETAREVITRICSCREFDKPFEKQFAVERLFRILECFKAASHVRFKVDMIPLNDDPETNEWLDKSRANLQRYLEPYQDSHTAARMHSMVTRTKPASLGLWEGYQHSCECTSPKLLCAQQRKQLLRSIYTRMTDFGLKHSPSECDDTELPIGPTPITFSMPMKPFHPGSTCGDLQHGDGTGAKPPDTVDAECAADCDVADCDVADCDVADCDVADCDVADCDVADCDVADCDVADCDVADCDVADCDVADCDVADCDVADCDVADCDVADCDVADCDVADCDVADCDVADCDVADCDVADCDVADCDVADCDVADCDVADCEVVDSDVAERGATDCDVADLDEQSDCVDDNDDSSFLTVSDSDCNSGNGSMALSNCSLDSASELVLCAAQAINSPSELAPTQLCRTVRHLMRSIASIEKHMDTVLKQCNEWPAQGSDKEARKKVDIGLSEVDRKLMAMYRRLPEVHRRQLQVYKKQKKLSAVCMQLVGGQAPSPPPPGSPPPTPRHLPCRALCPEYHLQRFKEVRRKVMHMRDQQLYYQRLKMWLDEHIKQEFDRIPDSNLWLIEEITRCGRQGSSTHKAPKRKIKPATVCTSQDILQLLKREEQTSPLPRHGERETCEAPPPAALPLEREETVSDCDTVVGEKIDMQEVLASLAEMAASPDIRMQQAFAELERDYAATHDFTDAELRAYMYPEAVSPPLQETPPATEPAPAYPNPRLISKYGDRDAPAPDLNAPLSARAPVGTHPTHKDPNINKYVTFGLEIKKAMEECQSIINSYNVKPEKEISDEDGPLSLEQICDVMMSLDKNSEYLSGARGNANTKLADLVENMPQILANMPEIASEFASASFELPEFASIINSLPDGSDTQLTAETLKQIRDLKRNKSRDSVKVTKNTAKRKTSRRVKNHVDSEILGTMTFEFDNREVSQLLKDEKELQALIRRTHTREDYKELLFSISAQVVVHKVFELLKADNGVERAKCIIAELVTLPRNCINAEIYAQASDLFQQSVKDSLSMDELRSSIAAKFDVWKEFLAAEYKSVPIALLNEEIEAMYDKFYVHVQNLANRQTQSDRDRIIEKLDEFRKEQESYGDTNASMEQEEKVFSASDGTTLDMVLINMPRLAGGTRAALKNMRFKYVDVLRRCAESQRLVTWILRDPELAANHIAEIMGFATTSRRKADVTAMPIEKKREYFMERLGAINKEFMDHMPRKTLTSNEWLVLLYRLGKFEEMITRALVKYSPRAPQRNSHASEAEILAAKGLSKIIGGSSAKAKRDANATASVSSAKTSTATNPSTLSTRPTIRTIEATLASIFNTSIDASSSVAALAESASNAPSNNEIAPSIFASSLALDKASEPCNAFPNGAPASAASVPAADTTAPPASSPSKEPSSTTAEETPESEREIILKCETVIAAKGNKALKDSFNAIKAYLSGEDDARPDNYQDHVMAIMSNLDFNPYLDDTIRTMLACRGATAPPDAEPPGMNPEELAKYSAQAIRNVRQKLNAVAFKNLARSQSKSESDASCDVQSSECKYTSDCACAACRRDRAACVGDFAKASDRDDRKDDRKREARAKAPVKLKPVPKQCENASHQQHVCKVGHTNGNGSCTGDGDQHCTCCYCTVFGHAPPLTTPVPRNFNETRERLRSILSKKKQLFKTANGELKPVDNKSPQPEKRPPTVQTQAASTEPPQPRPPALPKTLPPNLTAQALAKRQALESQQRMMADKMADKMAKMVVTEKPLALQRSAPVQVNVAPSLKAEGKVNPNAMEQIRLQQLKQQQAQYQQQMAQQKKPEPIYDLPIHNKPPQQQQQIRMELQKQQLQMQNQLPPKIKPTPVVQTTQETQHNLTQRAKELHEQKLQIQQLMSPKHKQNPATQAIPQSQTPIQQATQQIQQNTAQQPSQQKTAQPQPQQKTIPPPKVQHKIPAPFFPQIIPAAKVQQKPAQPIQQKTAQPVQQKAAQPAQQKQTQVPQALQKTIPQTQRQTVPVQQKPAPIQQRTGSIPVTQQQILQKPPVQQAPRKPPPQELQQKLAQKQQPLQQKTTQTQTPVQQPQQVSFLQQQQLQRQQQLQQQQRQSRQQNSASLSSRDTSVFSTSSGCSDGSCWQSRAEDTRDLDALLQYIEGPTRHVDRGKKKAKKQRQKAKKTEERLLEECAQLTTELSRARFEAEALRVSHYSAKRRAEETRKALHTLTTQSATTKNRKKQNKQNPVQKQQTQMMAEKVGELSALMNTTAKELQTAESHVSECAHRLRLCEKEIADARDMQGKKPPPATNDELQRYQIELMKQQKEQGVIPAILLDKRKQIEQQQLKHELSMERQQQMLYQLRVDEAKLLKHRQNEAIAKADRVNGVCGSSERGSSSSSAGSVSSTGALRGASSPASSSSEVAVSRAHPPPPPPLGATNRHFIVAKHLEVDDTPPAPVTKPKSEPPRKQTQTWEQALAHINQVAKGTKDKKPKQPAAPVKADPKPVETKPAPAKPPPTKPAPAKPAPAKLEPPKPAPAKPAPAKLEPPKPAPAKPAPPKPAPPKPAPAKPAPPPQPAEVLSKKQRKKQAQQQAEEHERLQKELMQKETKNKKTKEPPAPAPAPAPAPVEPLTKKADKKLELAKKAEEAKTKKEAKRERRLEKKAEAKEEKKTKENEVNKANKPDKNVHPKQSNLAPQITKKERKRVQQLSQQEEKKERPQANTTHRAEVYKKSSNSAEVEKPASCSIMEQLSCGIQVSELRLPPGITLTRVQPNEKKEAPAIKSVPLWKAHHLPATPTPVARPQPVINADPSMMAFHAAHPEPPKPIIVADPPPLVPAAKSKKSKKKGKKPAAAEPAPSAKMVTLRNPMFHPNLPPVQISNSPPAVNQKQKKPEQIRLPEPIPMPPTACQATITPAANGMYTIRNPMMSMMHQQQAMIRPTPPNYYPPNQGYEQPQNYIDQPSSDYQNRIMNLASFTQKNDEGYSLFKTSDNTQKSFLSPEYYNEENPKPVVSPNPIGTRPERTDANRDINRSDSNRGDLNRADITRIDMNQIDMSRIDLNRDMTRIDMNQIDMSRIDLNRDMNQVDMSRIDLNRDMNRIDMNQIDMSRIDLNRDMNRNDLNRSDMNRSDLNRGDMNTNNIGRSDINRCDININRSDLNRCEININRSDLNRSEMNLNRNDLSRSFDDSLFSNLPRPEPIGPPLKREDDSISNQYTGLYTPFGVENPNLFRNALFDNVDVNEEHLTNGDLPYFQRLRVGSKLNNEVTIHHVTESKFYRQEGGVPAEDASLADSLFSGAAHGWPLAVDAARAQVRTPHAPEPRFGPVGARPAADCGRAEYLSP